MSERRRFLDTRESILDMMDVILVVCPRCQRCARILSLEDNLPGPQCLAPRRVICAGCGFTKDWRGNSIGLDWDTDPVLDRYFQLPLYLQTPCCGHTLWAYNARHLNLMEAYVRADLREQEKDAKWGWSNGSLANRMPEWMIVAKHREPVLKAIAKLKARLVSFKSV